MSDTNLIPTLTVSESLQKSWNTIIANIWPFVGVTALYYVAFSIIGRIPGAGTVVNLFSFILPVCIFTGLHAADRQRGKISFNDLFTWTPKFGKLLLANLVLLLVGVVIFLPVIIIVIATIGLGFLTAIASNPGSLVQTGLGFASGGMIALLVLLSFVLTIVYLIVSFSYMFLILFYDMPIGEALAKSWAIGKANIGSLVLFLVIAIGVILLGVLALCVGILVAVPVITGMQYYFLRSIFPESDRESWDFMQGEKTPDILS